MGGTSGDSRRGVSRILFRRRRILFRRIHESFTTQGLRQNGPERANLSLARVRIAGMAPGLKLNRGCSVDRC